MNAIILRMMNISSRSSRNIKYFKNFKVCSVEHFPKEQNSRFLCNQVMLNSTNFKQQNKKYPIFPIVFAGLFFKSKSEEEESPEHHLITTIKRSILCIQRQEYNKAEQMLHLALKIAQEMQHKDGITYVYDVMANLAMEQEQFEKAEKLFTEVMRRLLGDGYKEDDNKILHISSKIAHMSQLKGQLEKAKQGFIWTIEKIEQKLKSLPNDNDLLELYGLTKNWYAQLLMQTEKFAEAKTMFIQAYDILTNEYGKFNEEALMILNNLSVACINLNDHIEAKKYLEEALELAKNLPEIVEVGVLKANLGLLYLKEGLVESAKEICSTAYRYGHKIKDKRVIEQAEYCLDQIQASLKK
ncbi:tetratricopeptide repeat protein 19 homolog, mitochondrial [Condylostylus longicornis]|uniref:tetratricopeptide repeat protein 19 homolog, mitochondrial n=1 Tax=Condylostylus longicornis TaxID=2530218 RepID=UPI00244DF71D|nr:tetratricopeptide repeat protein 19 homolog, mitochondrial [Condylostylus longicornis]